MMNHKMLKTTPDIAPMIAQVLATDAALVAPAMLPAAPSEFAFDA